LKKAYLKKAHLEKARVRSFRYLRPLQGLLYCPRRLILVSQGLINDVRPV